MAQLLVAVVGVAGVGGAVCDCGLEAAVLLVLILNLLDDFSGLASDHRWLAIRTSLIIVLLQVVRHRGSIKPALYMIIHRILLHRLSSATTFLLLLVNHVPPLLRSFYSELVERLLITFLTAEDVKIQDLARVEHVLGLPPIRNRPRIRTRIPKLIGFAI